MPLLYPFPIRSGGPDIQRSVFTSFPVDWYDAVLASGGAGIPVICFQHGGNQLANEFMFDTFHIEQWWTSNFPFGPIKAIAMAPQGVSLDSAGGDWNAGNMGYVNRMADVDDVAFFWDALDRLEQWFIDFYTNDIQPVTGGGAITTVFDRTRLMLVGFSEGGQFTYRLATTASTNGWTPTGLAIFGSSIGGWYRQADMASAPNVKWSPTSGNFCPLLHIHGNGDDHVNPVSDGVSTLVGASVVDQVGGPSSSLYARADISGQNSALVYKTTANAMVGWVTVGGAVPPSSIPAGVAAATAFTVDNWDTTGVGMVADFQVCFARVGGMVHVVPTWAPPVVAEFFQLWSGL